MTMNLQFQYWYTLLKNLWHMTYIIASIAPTHYMSFCNKATMSSMTRTRALESSLAQSSFLLYLRALVILKSVLATTVKPMGINNLWQLSLRHCVNGRPICNIDRYGPSSNIRTYIQARSYETYMLLPTSPLPTLVYK